MKIYRLTIRRGSSKIVSFDSSEARMAKDFERARRLRFVDSAELDAISASGSIKRATLLEALNGKTDHWQFQPVLAFSCDDERD